jgi:hypothetical protein
MNDERKELIRRLVKSRPDNDGHRCDVYVTTLQPAMKWRDRLSIAVDEMIDKLPGDDMTQTLADDLEELDRAIAKCKQWMGEIPAIPKQLSLSTGKVSRRKTAVAKKTSKPSSPVEVTDALFDI